MKAFCSECKCCEAQEGFELCIFCEDGVPCPNRQRAARPAITTTPAHIAPLAPKKPGHPRNPNSPWRGNARLHLSDKEPEKKAPVEVPTAGNDRQKEEKERTNMAAKLCACGCGTELKEGSVWDYVRGHKTKAGKKQRLCECGCGAPLVNRHPYIKGHNPGATKGPKKADARKPHPTPPPAIPVPR
jgi:hypothetical protein